MTMVPSEPNIHSTNSVSGVTTSSARFKTLQILQKRGSIVALVIMMIVSSFVFPGFFSVTNFENLALQGAFLGIVVIGQTLVIISGGGGIDLSVGSMMALAGILAAYASNVFWAWGLILPVLVGALVGTVNGVLIARFKMAPFIVTLAGLLGLRGLALAVSNQQDISITSQRFAWFGQGAVAGIGIPVFFFVILIIIAAFVLNKTRFGRTIFAMGGNEESARLMGVSVLRNKIVVYIISGALAGLSGAILAAELQAGQPTIATGWELDSISAVVVGGTLLTGGSGSLSGSFAGVILLSLIQNLINQVGTLGSYAQQVVSGAFLVIVVLIQAYLNRKQNA